MGKPQTRKKQTAGNKVHKRAKKLKNYYKDIDQVQEDLSPERQQILSNQPFDEDLPGLGQHYCIPCARYFISDYAQQRHVRTKEHKKRVRRLKEPVHTQADAERFAGLGRSTHSMNLD